MGKGKAERFQSKLVIAAWAIALALFSPLGLGVQERLETIAKVHGSEHERVEDILNGQFNTPLSDPLVLVVQGFDPGPQTLQLEILRSLRDAIVSVAPDATTLSYLDNADPLLVSPNGDGLIVLVGIGDIGNRNDRVVFLRTAVEKLLPSLREIVPGLTLGWTGAQELNGELREVSASDSAAAERRILPIAFLLLIIAFGSVYAGLLPVLFGVVAISISKGAISLLGVHFPLSIITVNVSAMLGLALSIDYTLLMVSRYREEIEANHSPERAVRTTKSRAGKAVAVSGAALALSMSGLLLVPINEIRSIAAGGLIVIIVSVLIAVTLTPAVLTLLGSHLGRVSLFPQFGFRGPSRFWDVLAGRIFLRPRLFLIIGIVPLLALGAQSLRLEIGVPNGEWLPESANSVKALSALEGMDRAGVVNALRIVWVAEDEVATTDWMADLTSLIRQIEADDRIAWTRTVPLTEKRDVAPVGSSSGPVTELGQNPTSGAKSVLILASQKTSLEERDVSALIRELRSYSAPATAKVILVGGPPALNADYQDSIRASSPYVALSILLSTFLSLVLGYRCLLLPLKAVALNVVSIGASIGALVLVFQDGIGAGLLGLDGPYGSIFANIPLLAFAIVFGLSMDYEVFLFSRITEAHRAGESDRDAMAIALGRTAGVISGAALIMVLVFGAFFFGEFLFVKMLGFTLAVAIIVDTFLIRLIVGPALFAIAGQWNWWPGRPSLLKPSNLSNWH